LWCDNIGATYLSCNPVFKAWSKRIECDYYFVRKQASQKFMQVSFISNEDQLADIFTKSLFRQRFMEIRGRIRLINKPWYSAVFS
jgi:hypothetical protein